MPPVEKNWFFYPSKLIVVLFVVFCLVSNALLIIGMTDLFTEPFFQLKHLTSYLLIGGSTFMTGWLVLNYKNNVA